jgi:hypothetical protein
MADPALSLASQPEGSTAVLVLADGSVAWGRGFGAVGEAVGEVCFNTAMTGYQEVMTDPSYASQIVTFTFPHIGNVGTNAEDMESHGVPGAVGCVVREDVTAPANFRAQGTFQEWMERQGRIGIAGVDTRALTRRIRLSGAPNAVIAHNPDGKFDLEALLEKARLAGPRRPRSRPRGQPRGSRGMAGFGLAPGAGLYPPRRHRPPACRRHGFRRQGQYLSQPGQGRGGRDGGARADQLR